MHCSFASIKFDSEKFDQNSLAITLSCLTAINWTRLPPHQLRAYNYNDNGAVNWRFPKINKRTSCIMLRNNYLHLNLNFGPADCVSYTGYYHLVAFLRF